LAKSTENRVLFIVSNAVSKSSEYSTNLYYSEERSLIEIEAQFEPLAGLRGGGKEAVLLVGKRIS